MKNLNISKPKSVNILGTEYKIKYQTRNDNKSLNDCFGYVEFYTKEIIIDNDLFDSSIKDGRFSDIFKKGYEVLRHEIIHAFIFESGLWKNCTWAENEEMTDFFALQIPKISKCFNDIKIL